MTKPRRHHYLPIEAHQNFFTDQGGKFLVFDRETKVFGGNRQPINTGVEKDYYTVQTKDGGRSFEVETELLAKIDDLATPVLRKIVSGNIAVLSDEDRESVAVFVAFLYTRVPDYEKGVNELVEKMIRKMSEVMFSTPEDTQRAISDIEGREGVKVNVSAEDLLEFISKGEYRINPSREWSIGSMISTSKEIIGLFYQMDWMFCLAPKGSLFITSDNPFVLLPPQNYLKNSWLGVGLLTPGARKIIPLSSKWCLVMGDHGGKTMFTTVPRSFVKGVNIAIAMHSDRWIISQNERLLRRVVEMTKADQWRIEQSVSIS